MASFLSLLTGSFSTPAGENPTVAMVEAAYRHHGLDALYLNCEVAPDALGDAVRGARAMGVDAGRRTPEGDSGRATDPFRRVPSCAAERVQTGAGVVESAIYTTAESPPST